MSRSIRKAVPALLVAAVLGLIVGPAGCGDDTGSGSGVTAGQIGLSIEALADVHLAKEVRRLKEGSPPYGATIGRVLKAEEIDGVWVREARPGSPAARAGLETGDLITAVDGDEVTTPEDVDEALDEAEAGSTVDFEGVYVISGDPTDFLDGWSAEVQLPGD